MIQHGERMLYARHMRCTIHIACVLATLATQSCIGDIFPTVLYLLVRPPAHGTRSAPSSAASHPHRHAMGCGVSKEVKFSLATLQGHTSFVMGVACLRRRRHAARHLGQRQDAGRGDPLAGTLATLQGHMDVAAWRRSPTARRALSRPSTRRWRVGPAAGTRLGMPKGTRYRARCGVLCARRRRPRAISPRTRRCAWGPARGHVPRDAPHTSYAVWRALRSTARRAPSRPASTRRCAWDPLAGTCPDAPRAHEYRARRGACARRRRAARHLGETTSRCACGTRSRARAREAQRAHGRAAWHALRSPTARHAPSRPADKTLRVWDLLAGTCLAKLKGHTSPCKAWRALRSPTARRAPSRR